MVNHTKLDTAQIIASGILGRVAPKSKQPAGLILASVAAEDSREDILAGLANDGIQGNDYYGVWRIWKEGDKYSGELLQYREMTDSFCDASISEAANFAQEWMEVCCV